MQVDAARIRGLYLFAADKTHEHALTTRPPLLIEVLLRRFALLFDPSSYTLGLFAAYLDVQMALARAGASGR